MAIFDRLSNKFFQKVHLSNLVYNQCWEDPRLDREALNLTNDDVVMCITSAGCNILDYLLDAPKHVYAVDMNPRQNHLLELKIAGIKALDFNVFFDIFGRGVRDDFSSIFHNQLKPHLSKSAVDFWSDNLNYFNGRGWRRSFYFHGTSGTFARAVNSYIDCWSGLRESVDSLLHAQTVDEQFDIYMNQVKDMIFKGAVRWAMNRTATLSLLGVPRAQRDVLEAAYDARISKFVQERVERVFAQIPIMDNYFWHVYLTGSYKPWCCPEYLKEENFERLKGGLIHNVSVHTNTIEGFLRSEERQSTVDRYVLLDHMDWMSAHRKSELASEWQAIVDSATMTGSRAIWRSAALNVDFVDPIEVQTAGKRAKLSDILNYNEDLAAELHSRDRVQTYGSFQIADLVLQ